MKMRIIFLFLITSHLAFAETKLIQAINDESVATVKALAKNKKLINKKDAKDFDPIHHAVSLNNLEIVKILVDSGANLNQKYGDKKESILFEATRLGSQEIVDFLLSKNSKLLEEKNINEETVLHEAVRAEQSELAAFYLKKGLSSKDKNKAGETAIDLISKANGKMKAVFQEQL